MIKSKHNIDYMRSEMIYNLKSENFIVGEQEVPNKNQLYVFPNPNTSETITDLHIRLQKTIHKSFKIAVFPNYITVSYWPMKEKP